MTPMHVVQVYKQLADPEKLLPWEEGRLSEEDKSKLGRFRKPIMELLQRDPKKRDTAGENKLFPILCVITHRTVLYPSCSCCSFLILDPRVFQTRSVMHAHMFWCRTLLSTISCNVCSVFTLQRMECHTWGQAACFHQSGAR